VFPLNQTNYIPFAVKKGSSSARSNDDPISNPAVVENEGNADEDSTVGAGVGGSVNVVG